jgi:Fuc2NAc and GlcNAc transferase
MSFLLASIGVVSFLGLWLFRKLAPLAGLLDIPGRRSQHQDATPLGGGIVLVVLSAACLVLFEERFIGAFASMEAVSIIAVTLSLVGLMDDRFGLGSGVRLIIYFIAAGVLVSFEFGGIEPWLQFLFLTALVWTINLFNFMDGADGFAITQALSVFVGMVFILIAGGGPQSDGLVSTLLLLIAVCFPFVIFNWPPASLFMGDAGSIAIGFLLGAVGIHATVLDPSLGWAWVILMAPFLLDASLTLLIRLSKRLAPHRPHQDHVYQRLARLMSQPSILVCLAFISAGGFRSRCCRLVMFISEV